jgi:hypothetical protein
LTESSVRFLLLAFVLACCLQVIAAGPALADTGRSAPRTDPTKLWSEFPLNPRERTPGPTRPPASVAQGTRTRAPNAPGSPDSSFPLSPATGFALMLAVLVAGGALLAVSLGLRTAWAPGVAWRLPRPRERESGARWPHHSLRQTEGALAMSKLVHRLLQFGGKRDEESQDAVASTSDAPRTTARMEIFTPYSMRERERRETLQQSGNPTERADSHADEAPAETKVREAHEAPAETKGRGAEKNFDQFGEKVAAVLASAERAAEQIRESAHQEAERLQTETQEKAAAKLSQTTREVERRRREIEQLRADADTYSKDTRAAADRYEAETRMKVEKEVAEQRAELHEQVRGIRRAAEQKAREIEADARRRQKALMQEVGRTDERLQQLLGIFRGMTTQLEGLVSTEPAAQPDEAKRDRSDDEALDEALSPQRSPSRSA